MSANGQLSYLVEPAYWIPNSLRQLGVLKQTVRSRRIKWAHTHVHARKCENASQPVGPKVFAGTTVDALKWMKRLKVHQESWARHTED